MYPKLIDSEWILIPSYGLLRVLAFLLGIAVIIKLAKKENLDQGKLYNLIVITLLASYVGAKLLDFVIIHRFGRKALLSLLSVDAIRSGGVFYGGFIAGTLALLCFVKRNHLSFWKFADLFSVGVAAGLIPARIGCFMGGCDYGKPTDLFLGVTFRDSYAHTLSGIPLFVPLHPTQLYEALACLIILPFLIFWTNRKLFDGQIFCLFSLYL